MNRVEAPGGRTGPSQESFAPVAWRLTTVHAVATDSSVRKRDPASGRAFVLRPGVGVLSQIGG